MNVAADTLANAMHEVATTLCPAKVAIGPWHTGINTNPNVTVAIALIESNKGLSDNKFSDVAQCITVNPTIATVYISMNNRTLHSRYIRKQVNSYRGLEAP
jgi:hypothetical protein